MNEVTDNKWKKIGYCGNRISIEIGQLIYEFNNVKITKDEKNLNLEINVMNHIINIQLDKSYPFSYPDVLIDYKNICKFYILPSKRMNTILEFNKLCFCCETILNKNRWSPCMPLLRFINQIYKIIYIKKRIYFYIMIEKIKRKYLNPNIDLFTYIFGDCKYNIRYPFIYTGDDLVKI